MGYDLGAEYSPFLNMSFKKKKKKMYWLIKYVTVCSFVNVAFSLAYSSTFQEGLLCVAEIINIMHFGFFNM